MNELSKLIKNLGKKELELIKKDLEAGNIERLINQKLQEKKQEEQNRTCPVCQAPIGEDCITLIFGPKGLRKKASFCALDCLEYFINYVKKKE